jgi:hypothetical protein
MAMDGTAETSEEPEPIAARRADALSDIAETYMNNSENSGSTADRYQVVVHVYPKGTRTANQVPLGQTPPHLDNGPHVAAVTSRRIACDCSTTTITEDENGEPLSIGRRSRSIPPPMRRALKARDGGCRFPGCTNHKFVDGHHIIHWADCGETSLDNLVLLCRHHHHLVHEGGFTCEKTNDGEIVFQDQRQEPLPEWSILPAIGEDDVNEWLDRTFFEDGIKPEGCAAQWGAGERMDWHMAVGNLFG